MSLILETKINVKNKLANILVLITSTFFLFIVGFFAILNFVALSQEIQVSNKNYDKDQVVKIARKDKSEDEYHGYIIELKSQPLSNENVELKKLQIDGKITKAQADERLIKLSQKIDTEHKNFSLKVLSLRARQGFSHSYSSSGSFFLGEYKNVFNGIGLNITDNEAKEIEKFDEVKKIYKNYDVFPLLMDVVPFIGADTVWNTDRLGNPCNNSENCIMGQGVKVGVVDSGIDVSHLSLGGTVFPTRIPPIEGGPFDLGDVDILSNQIIQVDDNRIFALDEGNILIYSYDQAGQPSPMRRLTLYHTSLTPYRFAIDDNLIVYYGVFKNEDIGYIGGVFSYDLDTDENKLIDETRIFSLLGVSNGKIVYVKENEVDETAADLYVYDVHRDEKIFIDRSLSHPSCVFMPLVSEDILIFQQRSGAFCRDTITRFYNLETRNYLDTRLPDRTDLVALDFHEDKVLFSERPEGLGEDSLLLYNIINHEWKTIAENIDGALLSGTLTPNANVKMYSWSSTAKIGDDIYFFNKTSSIGSIYVYDARINRTVWMNPLQYGGDFAVYGVAICFYDLQLIAGYHINCTEYSLINDYSLPKIFNEKVIGGYDFTRGNEYPFDETGHGTMVAGIIAGNGRFPGIAPQAQLFSYKVFNSRNAASSLHGIIQAVDMAISDEVDIINLSLGGSGNSDDALSVAVDNAVASGVVVVAAAGNSGPGGENNCRNIFGNEREVRGEENSICSPGASRKAVTVGATYKKNYDTIWNEQNVRRDQITSFSSRGPVRLSNGVIDKPDLVAPGAFVCTTKWYGMVVGNGDCHETTDREYTGSLGTSFSTPVVSGVAALMKQKHPRWKPEHIKRALMETANDIGYQKNIQGAGRVNARNTLDYEIFLRGDVNNDGTVNITDPIFLLNSLFLGGPLPQCKDASDSDDDGSINITDAIRILMYLYEGSVKELASPGAIEAGPDPTSDNLACDASY